MIRTTLSFVRQAATSGAQAQRAFSTTPRILSETLPKSNSPIVSKLNFFNSVTGDGTQIPTYRILDGSGKPLDGAELPEVRFPFFQREYSFTRLR